MTTTVAMSEAYISRDGSVGENGSRELVYYTFMTSSDPVPSNLEQISEAYVLANAPAMYDGMPYVDAARKQISDKVYQFTLHYRSEIKQVNFVEPTLSFSTIGGTSHITNSASYQQYIDKALVPSVVDYLGAIGVELNDDGTKARVRGVDIFTPIMDFSLAKFYENHEVTPAFTDAIFNLTGKVNSVTFNRRPPLSVLFKGCRGSKNGSEKWQLTFDFAYSPNLTNLRVGSITGVNKDGWQYLDILYVPRKALVHGLRVLNPGQVTVHTVYESGNFSALRLGV